MRRWTILCEVTLIRSCRLLLLVPAVLAFNAACTPTGTAPEAVVPGSPPGEAVHAPAAGGSAQTHWDPWPMAGDCRAMMRDLAAFTDKQRRLLDPRASPLALAVVENGSALPAQAVDAALVMDLPVPLAPSLDLGPAPCLLLLERSVSAPGAARRPLAHETVRSTYRKGTRRVTNEDHRNLQRAVREVQQDDGPEILATGDPALDLIGLVAGGVLGGIDLFRRRSEEERLRASLAATPNAFEEPVWEPYTYEVTTIEATRIGPLRAALVDWRLGRSWIVERTVRDLRSFWVAKGRHARDRDLIEGRDGVAATPADLDVWERGGLRPTLSEIVALLAGAAASEEGTVVAPATIATAWTRLVPVVVLDEGARGVVTEAAAARAAPAADGGTRASRHSLVEQVITADGTRRYRLVAPANEAFMSGP